MATSTALPEAIARFNELAVTLHAKDNRYVITRPDAATNLISPHRYYDVSFLHKGKRRIVAVIIQVRGGFSTREPQYVVGHYNDAANRRDRMSLSSKSIGAMVHDIEYHMGHWAVSLERSEEFGRLDALYTQAISEFHDFAHKEIATLGDNSVFASIQLNHNRGTSEGIVTLKFKGITAELPMAFTNDIKIRMDRDDEGLEKPEMIIGVRDVIDHLRAVLLDMIELNAKYNIKPC